MRENPKKEMLKDLLRIYRLVEELRDDSRLAGMYSAERTLKHVASHVRALIEGLGEERPDFGLGASGKRTARERKIGARNVQKRAYVSKSGT